MEGFYLNADEAAPGLIVRGVSDRQRLLRREFEDYLRNLSNQIEARRSALWFPDYSDERAYTASVASNRARWQAAVGDFGPDAADEEPLLEPFCRDEQMEAWWVSLSWRRNLRARAILAVPRAAAGPVPLVVTHHGLPCSPERTFGFCDPTVAYHAFARRLVAAGHATLAPMRVSHREPRARLQRLCLQLGGTLQGLEMAWTRHLLAWAVGRPDIDASRVGMWGHSLGGLMALHSVPLEPRVKVAIVSGHFNHRVRKMVIDDPRYRSLISADEEHLVVPSQLVEFSDSDLAALICPRPLLIQTGRADEESWWPDVAVEVEAARGRYERLGVGDRFGWELHEAGHEVRFDSGLDFLRRWL